MIITVHSNWKTPRQRLKNEQREGGDVTEDSDRAAAGENSSKPETVTHSQGINIDFLQNNEHSLVNN